MALTYSTSADCASAVNIRNLGLHSRPPETTFDTWRILVYAFMRAKTGGSADVDGVYLAFEVSVVARWCTHYLKGEPFAFALTTDESAALAILVGVVSGNTTFDGLAAWQPGQDATTTD